MSLLKVILKLIVHGARAPLQIFGTQRSPSGGVDISTKVESLPKNVSFPVVGSLVIVHKRDQREGANILSFMSQKWAFLGIWRSHFLLGSTQNGHGIALNSFLTIIGRVDSRSGGIRLHRAPALRRSHTAVENPTVVIKKI